MKQRIVEGLADLLADIDLSSGGQIIILDIEIIIILILIILDYRIGLF